MLAIVVHGGGINPLHEPYNQGVKEAADVGYKVLAQGGSALDAVVAALVRMEDNPVFNAGTGSWPNLKGEIEMDAILIDGSSGRWGAVGAIRRVKNPILVAKKVMEETDHCILVGDGATSFARALGFEDYDPATEERRRQWNSILQGLKEGKEVKMLSYWRKIKRFAQHIGTVGAVALDSKGSMAAGTSTGGFPLKLPGRIGDVPLLGCATYVEEGVGGVSLTGHGEVIMKSFLGREICSLMKEHGPQGALERAFYTIHSSYGEEVLLGGIALSCDGAVGAARNRDAMPHAYMSEGLREPSTNFGRLVMKR